LRVQECTQDKTRREEDTSLSQFTHQFGRGSLLKISIILFQRTQVLLLEEKGPVMNYKEAYKRSFPRLPKTLPLLAPKMESEGAPSRLFLKLTPIDALHKRYL